MVVSHKLVILDKYNIFIYYLYISVIMPGQIGKYFEKSYIIDQSLEWHDSLPDIVVFDSPILYKIDGYDLK